VLVGFRTHFKSLRFHFISIPNKPFDFDLISVAYLVDTELGRANEALTCFANGVDDIVQSPNHSQKYHTSNDYVSTVPFFNSVVFITW